MQNVTLTGDPIRDILQFREQYCEDTGDFPRYIVFGRLAWRRFRAWAKRQGILRPFPAPPDPKRKLRPPRMVSLYGMNFARSKRVDDHAVILVHDLTEIEEISDETPA
jgi:hypothetical protein